MRCFLAVVPERALAEQIDAWSRRNYASLMARVPLQNLHLTTCFLGELDRGQLERLETCLETFTAGSSTVQLDELIFQSSQALLWLGASRTPPALDTLAERCRSLAGRVGVRVDKRRFRPHVTLARGVQAPIPAPLEPPDFALAIRYLSVLQSTRATDGVRYTELGQVCLSAS